VVPRRTRIKGLAQVPKEPEKPVKKARRHGMGNEKSKVGTVSIDNTGSWNSSKSIDERQTRKFVKAWNKANNWPTTENTVLPNMRYVKPNEVTWNEYDAPQIDLAQFGELLTQLRSNDE